MQKQAGGSSSSCNCNLGLPRVFCLWPCEEHSELKAWTALLGQGAAFAPGYLETSSWLRCGPGGAPRGLVTAAEAVAAVLAGLAHDGMEASEQPFEAAVLVLGAAAVLGVGIWLLLQALRRLRCCQAAAAARLSSTRRVFALWLLASVAAVVALALEESQVRHNHRARCTTMVARIGLLWCSSALLEDCSRRVLGAGAVPACRPSLRTREVCGGARAADELRLGRGGRVLVRLWLCRVPMRQLRLLKSAQRHETKRRVARLIVIQNNLTTAG